MSYKSLFSFILLSLILTYSSWNNVCLADPTSYGSTLEISGKEYYIHYGEVIGDSENGWVNGYRIAYKYQYPGDASYLRVLYEHTKSNDQYNGATWGGTPLQTITNNDITTKEIIFANPIDGSTHTFAYLGLGNYAWNRLTTGSGGYLEKYSWSYIPVGYRNEYSINNKWDGAVDIALRFQTNSKMTAYFPGQNFSFTLGNLPGIKIELPFTYKMNKQWSLQISPWYEYWGINQSNLVPLSPPSYVYEPNSVADHYGIDLGIVTKF